MKEALGDRFLLVSLAILLLAILVCGYFIIEDSGIGLSFGQGLAERQKARAIDIAMADPLVKQELDSMAYGNNLPYSVNGVLSPSPFHELGPGIDRYRSLPAVEFIVGDEGQKGTNVLAFVDLAGDRVAYIGHMQRPDVYGQLPLENYANFSIADTGYQAGQVLTGEMREKAIRIALDNKTVQERMGGNNYTVDGDVVVTNTGIPADDTYYVGAYPFIRFTQGTSMYEPDFIVYAFVDVYRGKVINSMVVVRTPIIRETPTPAPVL